MVAIVRKKSGSEEDDEKEIKNNMIIVGQLELNEDINIK